MQQGDLRELKDILNRIAKSIEKLEVAFERAENAMSMRKDVTIDDEPQPELETTVPPEGPDRETSVGQPTHQRSIGG